MQQGNKIILVLGILVIGAGFLVRQNYASFLEKSTLTEGKVVHVLGSSYRIQYFTSGGEEKIKYGSGKNHGYREGANVTVWYRNDDPDKARFSDGKKAVKWLFISGVVCILLGIYPLFMKKQTS